MRTVWSTSPRDNPHWTHVCISALVVLGVVAMLNMFGAAPESMAMPTVQSHETVQSHGTVAGSHDSNLHVAAVAAVAAAAAVVPTPDGGMSMSDCCGLTALCLAMIAGISALLIARRPSGGRVMWQIPRPRAVTLGRAVTPFFSVSPLQRTAVLRL